ncbi:MAG: CvpA family protein, partial [Oscillibacter sp.]|nr:CvpA family protein [Oscillibacter sp.]
MAFTFNFGGGFNPGGFGGFHTAGGTGDPFQAQTPPPPKKPKKPRKAIGNAFTRTLINLAVTLVFGLVYFYVELPAINLHAEEFYAFAFLLCAVYCVCAVITSGFQGESFKGYVGFVKKQCAIPFVAFLAMIAAIAIGAISSWVVLRAG